jgi:hypothetical protein
MLKMQTYKNDIIASSLLLDILSSGKSSTQIRDQIVAVLTHYNTNKSKFRNRNCSARLCLEPLDSV